MAGVSAVPRRSTGEEGPWPRALRAERNHEVRTVVARVVDPFRDRIALQQVVGRRAEEREQLARIGRRGASQAVHAEAGRMAGMRSWMGSRVALAVVVMIEKVRSNSASGCVGSRQIDQRPANAIGSPSARWIRFGWRISGVIRSHS